MKEALYWKKEGKSVRCELCPHNCLIKEDGKGFCGARKNIKGKLFSLVYANPSSLAVDPIEKKPLYHFLPNSKSFSIGTFGCNLLCLHCQNYEISREDPEKHSADVSPARIVELAINEGCKSISYTYNEPTIFFEYMIDTAKLAKRAGLKNIIVSNGYINQKPLKELLKHIDGANIDLKSFNNDFYKKICSAELDPVLETLKTLNESKVWFEITNLIIPTKNDNIDEIKEMCSWIKTNLGTEHPLHFSAFFPTHKLRNVPPTTEQILHKARDAALDSGLKHVYIGNVRTDTNTMCPKCKKVVIERAYFTAHSKLKNGKCPNCKEKIAGVF
ncbi:MAG: AmmeMemoRadiSam system radical SAM enzyme [bacterium]|nr:AmmeMemoRadiSam system radical SAM enzyme [bacterium]